MKPPRGVFAYRRGSARIVSRNRHGEFGNPSVLTMKPFGWVMFAGLNARGIMALIDHHHHTAALPLADGSFLNVDNELPRPTFIDGAPSKLYTISLGRTWRNASASVDVSTAIEEKKLMRRNWQGRRSLRDQGYLDFEDTPLFPGWGTHFAYVYVGSPPQRVSVIIDTGSHFTAFPCAECKNCGSHTDPHWDHHKSSTSAIVSCENCHGSFRYTGCWPYLTNNLLYHILHKRATNQKIIDYHYYTV